MAWPLVSPYFYVVLIKLPLKQPIESLPCIFVKPQFQAILWSDRWNIKSLRNKSIAFFRFEKSVLASEHFFHSRVTHLNGSSQKFKNHIFSSPYRIQDFLHYLMWQGCTRVPYSKWNTNVHRGTPQTSPDDYTRFTIPVLCQWSWNKYRRVTDYNSNMKKFISFSSTHVEQEEPQTLVWHFKWQDSLLPYQ